MVTTRATRPRPDRSPAGGHGRRALRSRQRPDGGTSLRGRRHRRDSAVSASALTVLLSTAGGLLLLAVQHVRPGAPATPAAGAGALARASGAPAPAPASPGRPAQSPPGGVAVLGDVVPTDWGDVQVRLDVSGHRIVAVAAVKHPDAGVQSRRINARALPILYRETVTAQNARIDAVSGATITSTGYVRSLQSAIDRGHLN